MRSRDLPATYYPRPISIFRSVIITLPGFFLPSFLAYLNIITTSLPRPCRPILYAIQLHATAYHPSFLALLPLGTTQIRLNIDKTKVGWWPVRPRGYAKHDNPKVNATWLQWQHGTRAAMTRIAAIYTGFGSLLWFFICAAKMALHVTGRNDVGLE